MVVWRHDAAHLRAIDNTSSARLPGNGGALAALAPPTVETQSSANFAIGTVPGVSGSLCQERRRSELGSCLTTAACRGLLCGHMRHLLTPHNTTRTRTRF